MPHYFVELLWFKFLGCWFKFCRVLNQFLNYGFDYVPRLVADVSKLLDCLYGVLD